MQLALATIAVAASQPVSELSFIAAAAAILAVTAAAAAAGADRDFCAPAPDGRHAGLPETVTVAAQVRLADSNFWQLQAKARREAELQLAAAAGCR